MSTGRLFDAEPVYLVILRMAAVMAPGEQRSEWLAEWRSELWYVRKTCGRGPQAFTFCLGAFKDALWLRRNRDPRDARKPVRLESPLHCILLLAILAATCVLLAFRLPGARDAFLPSPYLEARSLAMISPDDRLASRNPVLSKAEFLSLRSRGNDLFSGLAFYEPTLARVGTVEKQTVEMSIAFASGNLFELLDLPFPSPATADGRPALILSQTAWSKYFDRDPDIAGRVLDLAGQRVRVAGVIPSDLWRLPGQVDAWLLGDEQILTSLPPDRKGFVLARLRSAPTHMRKFWHMTVPKDDGGYQRFLCASLARRHAILPHAFILLVAFLLLPVTTTVSLGEYPVDCHSPAFTIRLRRWVLLAVKFILLILIVFFGSLDLAAGSPVQPHGLMVGYILAFRWALIDQRRRCPVCLRLLSNPMRVGWSSQTFLGWYGTELICRKGHGLLHVPEIRSSCYGTQRWLYLDRSWKSLFT